MKKKILIIATVAIFAACTNKPTSPTNSGSAVLADTATTNHNSNADKSAEIQLNGVSDTLISNDGSQYVKVKPREAAPAVAPPVAAPAKVETAERKVSSASRIHHHTTSTGTSSGASTSANSTVSNGNAGTSSTTVDPAPVAKPRAKFSKAAKGAVIGAGAGAVAGAIISKKKGVGAIIGGVVGAGGGYIIGRGKDKKDGRY